ncbi:MAG: YdeI/OmpD-associated family protein [Bdellovibrionota bacterium]
MATETKKKTSKNSAGPVHNLPNDFQEAISSKASIKKAWDKLTPLARNEWICWVISAKKEDTRVKRIKRAQEELNQGKKRPCCWPGCPHRRPSAAKWFKDKPA